MKYLYGLKFQFLHQYNVLRSACALQKDPIARWNKNDDERAEPRSYSATFHGDLLHCFASFVQEAVFGLLGTVQFE